MGFTGAYQYAVEIEFADGLEGELCLRAIEDARIGEYGSTVVTRLVTIDGRAQSFRVKVLVSGDVADLRYGDRILVRGSLRGVGSPSSYYRSNAIVARCNAKAVELASTRGPLAWICHLRGKVVDGIDSSTMNSADEEDGAAVLAAVVCGYRTGLFASDAYEEFKIAGVGHLVAVSGAHLAVMFGLICAVLKGAKVRRRLSLALQLGFLLAYLVFSAIPISALRAAVMVGLGLMAFFPARRASTMNALGFCIVGVLAISPHAALSASFILSASSTLGIVLFCSLCNVWLKTVFPFFPKGLREVISMTLSASILSLPLSVALFSQCSLITLLSNLICAPLFTLVCTLGFIAASVYLAFPLLGVLLIGAAIAMSRLLCSTVGLFAKMPYACVAADLSIELALAMAFTLGFLLWLLWPHPQKRGVALLICLSAAIVLAVFIAGRPQDRIVMFDVGQGDAIMLQSGGRTIVIDTGNEPAMLKKALARSHVTQVDAVILTHVDDDHTACLDVITRLCRVDSVYVSDEVLAGECASCIDFVRGNDHLKTNLKGLDLGQSIVFGHFRLDVLWPEQLSDCGGNSDSLVLLLTVDGFEGWEGFYGLFTGDAGEEQLERIIAEGFATDLDLLKVGHHGSRTALSLASAEALDPEIALISVGADNRYGHPTEEVLDILEAIGCTTYRTDVSGDISVIFSNRGVEVRTQR